MASLKDEGKTYTTTLDTSSSALDTSSSALDTSSSTLDTSSSALDTSSSTLDTNSSTLDSSNSASDTRSDAPPDTTLENAAGASKKDDDDGVSGLMNFLKTKLTLGDCPSKKVNKAPPNVLKTLDIEGVVEYMKSGKCKNIITMAGAGISTSAGIPDFRSPGSGLYSNLQKYDLPYPEAIFELNYFTQNPQPFFTLARELYPGTFNPTPSHYFIKMLEEKGLLLRHFTQNIDTLEHIAGISDDKLVEAHGSFRTAHCLHCNKLYDQNWIKDKIFADLVPSCESCAGVVKPDIVFFGEGLSQLFFERIGSDFPECDLLIIMGTSLTVQPFASLVDDVSATCPRLLINREAVVSESSRFTIMERLMGQGNRKALDMTNPHNTRDVSLLGDCDEGCNKMIDLLGWREEFDELVNQKIKTAATVKQNVKTLLLNA